MARLKVDPVVAKKVLNHRGKKLDETYDVFEYFEEKRAALELIERHLLNLLQAPSPDSKSGFGDPIENRLPHMVVTGQTQEACKATTL